MYAIDVSSKAFEGSSIVKQHRMVNQILKDEIKDMHGLQVRRGVRRAASAEIDAAVCV